MKKLIFMAAVIFAVAASAQETPKATTAKAGHKECTAAEKKSCSKDKKSCSADEMKSGKKKGCCAK